MARKLPWQKQVGNVTPTRAASSGLRHATPTGGTKSDDSSARKILGSVGKSAAEQVTQRSDAPRSKRSPSTSQVPQPPAETYMIDGFDNDDGYRMVEDELRAVAGQFTAHLHAAEYRRLKAQARSQNAATIRSMPRPVSGAMTEAVRRRKTLSAHIKRRNRGIHAALALHGHGASDVDEDEDDELPGVGTPLQGLMNSPRKKQVPLSTTLPHSRGSTGAGRSNSYGEGRPQSSDRDAAATSGTAHIRRPRGFDESTDDEDDLDKAPSRPSLGLQMRSRPPSKENDRLADGALTHLTTTSRRMAMDKFESERQGASSEDESSPESWRRRIGRSEGRHHSHPSKPSEMGRRSLDTIPSFI